MSNIITPKIAVDWIQSKEPIAAKMNFHLGLTGSVLFKGSSTKDFDVIAYPHDPHLPHDKAALLKALGVTMSEKAKVDFKMFEHKDYGRNVAVCQTADFLRVDIFFMS